MDVSSGKTSASPRDNRSSRATEDSPVFVASLRMGERLFGFVLIRFAVAVFHFHVADK